MDCKKLIEDLKNLEAIAYGYNINGIDCSDFEQIMVDAAEAIEELLKYKKAVERMGSFGSLFVKYKGDPRGPVGRAGGVTLEEEAAIMPVLTDVDGGKWRPVNVDVLKDLFNRVASEKNRAENAERKKDSAIKTIEAIMGCQKLCVLCKNMACKNSNTADSACSPIWNGLEE